MVYHGITTRGQSRKSQVDFDRFQKWNLNSVMFECIWSEFQNQRGDLLQPSWDNLKLNIALAKQNGLKPFIGLRQYNNHNASDRDLCYDEDARKRYCHFIWLIAGQHPDVTICPLFFPFHAAPASSSDVLQYRTVLFPAMATAIREKNQEPIIYAPVHQSLQDWIQTRGYESLTPDLFAEKNLIWNINTHDGYNNTVQGESWDEDLTKYDNHFAAIRTWHQRFPSQPIVSIEYSNCAIHSPCSKGCQVRPIDPTRLAWVRKNMETMKELNASWFYYNYTPSAFWATPQESDGSDSELALIIKHYAEIEAEPPPAGENPFLLLFMFMLFIAGLVWISSQRS